MKTKTDTQEKKTKTTTKTEKAAEQPKVDYALDNNDVDEGKIQGFYAVHKDNFQDAKKGRIKGKSQVAVPAKESLVGKCLVHIGETENEHYQQAVIYITECTPEVVRGVVVNKLLFGSASVELKARSSNLMMQNVYEDLYQGGPESPAHGVVLFPTEDDTQEDPFAENLGDISVSNSFGVLQEILDGIGPSRKIIAMGHCVWRRGQLEWELFKNQWLIVPCSLKLLFDTKFDDRWELAKKESGVYNGAYITPQIGLA